MSLQVAVRRLRLLNHNFTIISNNCSGGIMYHSLGEKFLSPTINTMIHLEDYKRLLTNLPEAMEAEIVEFTNEVEGVKYPIGLIRLSDGSTIQIDFVHYQTFAEAQKSGMKEKTE